MFIPARSLQTRGLPLPSSYAMRELSQNVSLAQIDFELNFIDEDYRELLEAFALHYEAVADEADNFDDMQVEDLLSQGGFSIQSTSDIAFYNADFLEYDAIEYDAEVDAITAKLQADTDWLDTEGWQSQLPEWERLTETNLAWNVFAHYLLGITANDDDDVNFADTATDTDLAYAVAIAKLQATKDVDLDPLFTEYEALQQEYIALLNQLSKTEV